MSIGKRIKIFRHHKKLTQKQLGEIVGKANSTIQQYEYDISTMPDSIMEILRLKFGLNPDWLKTGAGEQYIVDNISNSLSVPV